MAEFLQPDRSLRRTERRPFRPPWRKRFSLGRESFGGRSFRFTWSHDGLHGRGLLESGRAVPLIKQDGLPAALPEKNLATNGNGIGQSAATRSARIDRSAWMSQKIRFGRHLWKTLHRIADGWPCRRCRPQMTVWMQGLHDAVNVRLGRPVFFPESYARYSSGSLDGGFHLGCIGCRVARVGSRLVARAPSPYPRKSRSD